MMNDVGFWLCVIQVVMIVIFAYCLGLLMEFIDIEKERENRRVRRKNKLMEELSNPPQFYTLNRFAEEE